MGVDLYIDCLELSVSLYKRRPLTHFHFLTRLRFEVGVDLYNIDCLECLQRGLLKARLSHSITSPVTDNQICPLGP